MRRLSEDWKRPSLEVAQVVFAVVVGEFNRSRMDVERESNCFSELVSMTDMRYPRRFLLSRLSPRTWREPRYFLFRLTRNDS